MKIKKEHLILLLILGLIFPLMNNIHSKLRYEQEFNVVNPKSSGGYNLPFIHIDGSNPKNWTWTVGNKSWCLYENGYYIIENVTINANNTPTGSGILIENSKNDYFIIRNCTVYNSRASPYDAGIRLENTCNGTLINNNCYNNSCGIYFYSNCNKNNITGNTINHNDNYGIYLKNNCSENILSRNNVSKNDNFGIYFENDNIPTSLESKNNIITNNSVNENGFTGISLFRRCSNNFIFNNTINNNIENGIDLSYNCVENNITENKINNNDIYGLYLFRFSDDNKIRNNTIDSNGDIGIFIHNFCDDNKIRNNTINRNDLGIGLNLNSNNNNISGNILHNNGWCIYETDCIGTILEFNNCTSNMVESPIYINGSATGVGAHNWTWAEGKTWCTGLGTWKEPYIIENLIISGFGIYHCIEILNSNVSFIIRDCMIKNSDEAGISFKNVNNSRLINNNCSNHSGDGIYIEYSNNMTIVENTFNNNNNGYGLFLKYCDYNNITGNCANYNSYGISLDYSSDKNLILENNASGNSDCGFYSEGWNNTFSGNTGDYNQDGIYIYDCCYNNISGNFLNHNTQYGIYLYNGCEANDIIGNTVCNNVHSGIYVENDCNNNTIMRNNINNNTENGILLHNECNNTISENTLKNNNNGIILDTYCYYNKILGNKIEDNIQDGILILGGGEESSDYNKITHNIFYNNLRGISLDAYSDNNTIYENLFLANGIHAIDNGTDNKWNSTLIGNYWDNHTSPDTNNDGIVDDPYIYISGLAGSIDYLPIAELSITINVPSAGSVFGIMAPSFEVTINYIYVVPKWYTIDGGIHNYTFTEMGVINQSAWDALSDGDVTLTFYARDLAGNTGSKEVIIQKDTQAPVITINSPTSGDEFSNTPPSFNITIADPNLDTIWYTLNSNITILGHVLVWTIPQEVWDTLPEGSVTITVYANDTLGHISSQSLTLTKNIPSSKGIGLDYFMMGVLITLFSCVAIVVVITKMYRKKQLT